METKTNHPLISILAVLSLTAGGALLGYSLYMLPAVPAYGFPWAFAGAVLSLLPIAVGGWCFGSLMRRRKSEPLCSCYGHDERSGGVVFALWVIIAGILLLCFNSEALPLVWRRVFFSWQMLLLLCSMSELARGRFVWGGVLLAAGGFFVIRRLEPLYPDLAASGIGISFWPVLLIIAGILILGAIFFKPRHGSCCKGCGPDGKWGGGTSKASGVIDITTVFGGSEQVYLDPVFRGGEISTVFGGVKLDLRRTELPDGDTFLKIESVFGGVEIDTPEEWIIEIRNESVFGGFSDKRLPPVGGYTQGRKLIIKASNVFGGGEVK